MQNINQTNNQSDKDQSTKANLGIVIHNIYKKIPMAFLEVDLFFNLNQQQIFYEENEYFYNIESKSIQLNQKDNF
jgi:hypothetical protein